jgi:hypothetical protein
MHPFFAMKSVNRSSDLLSEKKEKKKSIKDGKEVRKMFKAGLEWIDNRRLETQRKKQLEVARLEMDRTRKAEETINFVRYYGP